MPPPTVDEAALFSHDHRAATRPTSGDTAQKSNRGRAARRSPGGVGKPGREGVERGVVENRRPVTDAHNFASVHTTRCHRWVRKDATNPRQIPAAAGMGWRESALIEVVRYRAGAFPGEESARGFSDERCLLRVGFLADQLARVLVVDASESERNASVWPTLGCVRTHRSQDPLSRPFGFVLGDEGIEAGSEPVGPIREVVHGPGVSPAHAVVNAELSEFEVGIQVALGAGCLPCD